MLLDRLWPGGRATMKSLWEYVRRRRDKLGRRPAPTYALVAAETGQVWDACSTAG